MSLFLQPRGSSKMNSVANSMSTIFNTVLKDMGLITGASDHREARVNLNGSGFYNALELISTANAYVVYNVELDAKLMLEIAAYTDCLPSDKQDYVLSNMSLFYYLKTKVPYTEDKSRTANSIYIRMVSINLYYRHCGMDYNLPKIMKREWKKRYQLVLDTLNTLDKKMGRGS